VDQLSCLITISPVIGSTYSIFPNEKVLRVVNVLVRAGLDAVDYLGDVSFGYFLRLDKATRVLGTHTRFQIYQYGSRDVSRIVRLVEEDIFAITALCRELL